MHCASCKILIEKSLSQEDGVKSASINYGTETLQITYNDDAINLEDVDIAVRAIGDYKLILTKNTNVASVQKEKEEYVIALRKRLIITAITSIPFVIMMLHGVSMFFADYAILSAALTNNTISIREITLNTFYLGQFFLASFILFYGGAVFYRSAWNAIMKKTANMDTLVVLGTTIAWLYSTIITFFP